MKKYLLRLIDGETLTREDTHAIMLQITEQKFNSSEVAALLMGIQTRGATVQEILGLCYCEFAIFCKKCRQITGKL